MGLKDFNERKRHCRFCGADVEDVEHIIHTCPVYILEREELQKKLQEMNVAKEEEVQNEVGRFIEKAMAKRKLYS